MYEIDFSGLPVALQDSALAAASETLDRVTDGDGKPGVHILPNSGLVVMNTEDDRLFGALRAAMQSAVRDELNANRGAYTDSERDEFIRNGVEWHRL